MRRYDRYAGTIRYFPRKPREYRPYVRNGNYKLTAEQETEYQQLRSQLRAKLEAV